MILHKDFNMFYDAILASSNHFKIPPALIEKDYYISAFLERLSEKIPHLLFKGGTSLSKCYKIIDRFSEDIDLTLDIKFLTQGNKKKFKQAIIEVCDELGLLIRNLDDIRSRRDYNRYEIMYPIGFNGNGIKQYILVETVYMVKAYPDELKLTSSIIYDFLKQIKEDELIKEYRLEPFKIQVQTLERTFVDKVFAICDYSMSGKISEHSRHIYDLYKIYDNIIIDNQLKLLINKVRNERKDNERCFSAKDGISVTNILKKIIKEEIYKKDYNNITEKLLYRVVKYDEAIKVLEKIIENKIFD